MIYILFFVRIPLYYMYKTLLCKGNSYYNYEKNKKYFFD